MAIRAALLSSVALITVAAAQAPEDSSAAIKEALARNQAALRQYSWIETTTISLKGEVKKQEKKQCVYGTDGKVQKTPLPGQAAPQQQEKGGGGRRGGRLKEAIVENKVEDLKDYMEKAAALVHQYVPPDPQKIQEAQKAGNVALQPSGGVTTLTVKSYMKAGDSLSLGFDPSAKAMRNYNVKSYVEKPNDDDLTLSVKFNSLPDGTTYPETVVLNVTAKNVVVNVTNSGYTKATK
jgi:flavin-binding protein dodecin